MNKFETIVDWFFSHFPVLIFITVTIMGKLCPLPENETKIYMDSSQTRQTATWMKSWFLWTAYNLITSPSSFVLQLVLQHSKQISLEFKFIVCSSCVFVFCCKIKSYVSYEPWRCRSIKNWFTNSQMGKWNQMVNENDYHLSWYMISSCEIFDLYCILPQISCTIDGNHFHLPTHLIYPLIWLLVNEFFIDPHREGS